MLQKIVEHAFKIMQDKERLYCDDTVYISTSLTTNKQ